MTNYIVFPYLLMKTKYISVCKTGHHGHLFFLGITISLRVNVKFSKAARKNIKPHAIPAEETKSPRIEETLTVPASSLTLVSGTQSHSSVLNTVPFGLPEMGSWPIHCLFWYGGRSHSRQSFGEGSTTTFSHQAQGKELETTASFFFKPEGTKSPY